MRYIVMTMVLMLACPASSKAQPANKIERETMRGLPGVALAITGIGKSAEEDGLSEKDVRKSVEGILRSSGILILTVGEARKEASKPWLQIRVTSTTPVSGGYGLCLKLELLQIVFLPRMPDKPIYTNTYMRSSTFVYNRSVVREFISDQIEPMVKAFAKDFRAVNPK